MPWRLQPLASHYFKLHIVLHRLQSAETVFVTGSPQSWRRGMKTNIVMQGLEIKKTSEIVSNGSPFVFQFVDCWFSGRIVCHASRAKFCRAHFRGWANECRKLRPWSCQLQSTISKASGWGLASLSQSDWQPSSITGWTANVDGGQPDA